MKALIAAAVAAFPLVSLPAAAAQEGIQVGILECAIGPGTGYIIGSTKDVSCTFKPSEKSFAPESYFGVVRKFGLDVGTTGTALMQWLVLAPSSNVYAPGALAGDYIGASAEVTAAVGGGANVLIGGSNRSFTLQPVSVQAQTGLNVAVGVAQFQLRSVDG